MQVFFALTYHGVKRKFQTEVTDYLQSLPGFQKDDMEGTNWSTYICIIPVADKKAAVNLRNEVESRCKKCKTKPYYFRLRNRDAEDISSLNIFGLTAEESKKFNEKAPPGIVRYIQV